MVNEERQAIVDPDHPLSQTIGILVRDPDLVPLDCKDLRSLPEEKKDAFFRVLADDYKFDIADIKHWVDAVKSYLFRRYKYELKTLYFDSCISVADCIRNVPPRVNPKQWAERVKWWASEEAKAKSATNKCNRRKLRMNHRAGSKSLATRRHEFEVETGEKPDKITMFRELHKDKSGQILDKEAAAALVAMEEQLAQHPSELQSYELREKVFHDVIGCGTRNRVTGLGTGASRARIEGTGRVGSSLRAIELEHQLQELQANAEVAASTQASMKATIDTLLTSQASLQERMTEIARMMQRGNDPL